MKKIFILLLTMFSFATASWSQLLEGATELPPSYNYVYDFGQPTNTVSRMPGFIDGIQGFAKFMIGQIKYSEEAAQKQIEGIAVADFVVEVDGTVSNIKLVNLLGYGLDEEVLNGLTKLPKWSPALNTAGEPMRVRMQIPLTLQPPKPGTFKPKSTKKTVSKSKSGTKTPKKN
jgi:Gram-negative bacterial TonB protein C-terminal